MAAWISETLQRPVSDVSGWKYLKRLGWTLQTPRPQHQAAAPPDEQQAFKKKLKERVAVLESQDQEKPVEIWAEDETRLGLLPVHRRVWAKQGERPIAPVCPAYKWLYGFGFVRPQTGETYWLLMPSVSVEVMNLALAEFARDVNPDGQKQIILLLYHINLNRPCRVPLHARVLGIKNRTNLVNLVLDRAGFHTGKGLEVPQGIELFYLPPYTPELQPAERLWSLLREVVVNKVWTTLSALEEVLVERCRWFSENREKVQAHVGFQWICKMEKQ